MHELKDEIMGLVEAYHEANQHGTPEEKTTTHLAILGALDELIEQAAPNRKQAESVEISAKQGEQILQSLEGISIDTDITLEAAPKTVPTAEEIADYEALRGVYEQARGVLRYDGIDQARAVKYLDGLKDAIELVKQIDGGTWEPTPADGSPTESVLIDGTPYTVPAQVAAELLRLHMELKEDDTPVGGQSRFGSEHWGYCTVEHVRMVKRDPSYAAKGYEARFVYSRPASTPPPPPTMNVLEAVERHAKAHIIEIENLLSRRF